MARAVRTARRVLGLLWHTDRPLTAVGLIMLATCAAALIGSAIDPRVITGAPAWLKPAKFGISTAIYSLTLTWVFTYLPDWPRLRRTVSWTTAIVFVLEIVIIDLQAWRGTTSHFNVGTPRDAILFATMGTAIFVQTIASVAVAVALWRQQFADAVMGTALRAGMAITIVGAMSGGLMTRPTGAQLAEARATHRLAVAGAHTVGAADGGPGLPGTGWSREHGDLRVPHFVGLHALQVLPLVALVIRRRRQPAAQAAVMRTAAIAYAALFGILLLQALRGEPLIGLSSTTLGLLGGWALLTAVTATLVARTRTTKTRRERSFVPSWSQLSRF